MGVIKTSFIGLLFGTIGTVIGGLIGIGLKNISNRFLSLILSFASGLMLSIICFDLLPEASNISSISSVLFGILLGAFSMIICDMIVKSRLVTKYNKVNSLLKTGIIVSIGLALHNIPEGLAIGTGFESSAKLGLSLAIAIAIHDVPEGLSMAAPLKSSGLKSYKILFYVLLSGLATGIGAMLGSCIGKISPFIISFSLSFAAGAMLYIVSGELTPEYIKLYNGRTITLGNILGFIIGLISTSL